MTGQTRYPYFGVPPARQPRPASKEPALTGKRLVLSGPEGFVYDMRAAGELQTDGAGNSLVAVLTERQYFERTCWARLPLRWTGHPIWCGWSRHGEPEPPVCKLGACPPQGLATVWTDPPDPT